MSFHLHLHHTQQHAKTIIHISIAFLSSHYYHNPLLIVFTGRSFNSFPSLCLFVKLDRTIHNIIIISLTSPFSLFALSQQFGELLGRGGFGLVYKGMHVHTGETVAIKALPKDVITDDQLEVVQVCVAG
jgi:hypothetical protein